MFDNHIIKFNEFLLSGYTKKNGKPQFTEIKEYEDFFSGPGEYIVINVCEAAGIWGEKINKELHHYLTRRNKFAHPSTLSPTREQANEYIKNLIDILAYKPFKATKK